MKSKLAMMGGTIALVGLLAGCASKPPVPAAQLSQTSGSIRSAHELGADQDPHSAYYLDLANKQLGQAKKRMESGDNNRAAALLMRSEADADVARELARDKSARIEAEKTIREVQDLKARIGGSTP